MPNQSLAGMLGKLRERLHSRQPNHGQDTRKGRILQAGKAEERFGWRRVWDSIRAFFPSADESITYPHIVNVHAGFVHRCTAPIILFDYPL
jgi:hypothetical protein